MNEPTENFIVTFQSLMKKGDKQQAEYLLKKSVADMPHNWRPISEYRQTFYPWRFGTKKNSLYL